MSERSLSVNPVIEPCAGGVIGLGVGYSLAPKKYSLQKLLTLEEDKFNKIYSKDLESNLKQGEKEALQTIRSARNNYKAAKKISTPEVKVAARDWMILFRNIPVSNKLKKVYLTSKKNLQQAIKENNYIELNQIYRKAKAALKQSPDDKTLQTALTEANSNLARAKAIISSKIELFKNSVTNITNEQLYKVKNEPVKYANVRDAYHNFLKVLAKRRTLASNKLFSLIHNKEIANSYEILSEYLPKARTKSALGGAAIFGVLTSILMTNMTKSPKKKYA